MSVVQQMRSTAAESGGQPRVELILQQQAALLQATQGKLIYGRLLRCAVNQVIEIGVLDAQFNQLAMG